MVPFRNWQRWAILLLASPHSEKPESAGEHRVIYGCWLSGTHLFCQIFCPAGEEVGGSVGTVVLLKVSMGRWGGRQAWFWLWYLAFPGLSLYDSAKVAQ